MASVTVLCKMLDLSRQTPEMFAEDLERELNSKIGDKEEAHVSISLDKIDRDRVLVCVAVDPLPIIAGVVASQLAPVVAEKVAELVRGKKEGEK